MPLSAGISKGVLTLVSFNQFYQISLRCHEKHDTSAAERYGGYWFSKRQAFFLPESHDFQVQVFYLVTKMIQTASGATYYRLDWTVIADWFDQFDHGSAIHGDKADGNMLYWIRYFIRDRCGVKKGHYKLA